MTTPFLYQLLAADFASLTTASFKAAVVDIDDSKLDATQLQALEDQGKKVFAYISIGEAESYRAYWTAGDWSVTPPDFLLGENPDWAGNFQVKFWDADWQSIIFARIDEAVALGYDGIYLDIVDAYQQAAVKAAYTGADIRAEMVAFVIAISEHAKALDPSFKIIPQNATGLLGVSDSNASAPNLAYLNAIDGIGVEDLWYNDNEASSWTTSDLAFLAQALAADKFVLATSYPTEDALQADFVAKAIAAGFIPFVADRLLNGELDPINETIADLLPQSTHTPWAAPPTVAGPLSAAGAEDGGVIVVDLLEGASDSDGDALSISDTSALPPGVTLEGSTLNVDTSHPAFQSLAAGATQVIGVAYNVVAGADTVAQTATVTVAGVNDAPVLASPLTLAVLEDGGVATIDLLTGASDVDGDILSVADLSALAAGLALEGAVLSLDAGDAAFQSLAAGAVRSIEISYAVSDGAGGFVQQTATLTVTGVNDAALVGGVTAGAVSEDGVLAANGALTIADPDADEGAFIAQSGQSAYGAFLLNAAGEWTYALDNANAAVQALNAAQTLTDTIVVKSVDGTEASVAITIAGADDANLVTGSNADDDLRGTTGDDLINGLAGRDDIWARGGNDVVFAGDGYDEVSGGSGDDEIHGGASRDVLEGDDGNDRLYGDEGYDELNAGDGDDRLFGGGDEDDLSGEDGDDTIDGGAGDDWLDGARGADVYVFTAHFGEDTVASFDDGPYGHDLLDISALGVTAADFEERVSITTIRGAVLVTVDDARDQVIIVEYARYGSIDVSDFILA